MAEITAATVKALRETSGAGMMDCKTASKKSSRTAAEGLIGVVVNGLAGAAVEVNSETDFVAKNEQFQNFVATVTQIALELGDDVEALRGARYPDGGTVADKLTNNIATIGENQTLRRARKLVVNEGLVVPYIHNAAAPGLGKIGVLVALESAAPVAALEALGKSLAMHVAAAFPLALNEAGIPADLIERERAIAAEKAAESGKPVEFHAKMIDGAVAKFAKENALLNQVYVIDGKTKIADVVAQAGKAAGAPITLVDYVRFQLGEGIEREATDFAAEVAAAAGV